MRELCFQEAASILVLPTQIGTINKLRGLGEDLARIWMTQIDTTDNLRGFGHRLY